MNKRISIGQATSLSPLLPFHHEPTDDRFRRVPVAGLVLGGGQESASLQTLGLRAGEPPEGKSKRMPEGRENRQGETRPDRATKIFPGRRWVCVPESLALASRWVGRKSRLVPGPRWAATLSGARSFSEAIQGR